MQRPTFFLSSTIYDFQDLRGAVKHYLQRQGCRVLASEFNDFTKPLDRHSYDACLSTIEQADYFVLFIGSRVGGWYDEAKRVTIARQEYRTAYELQKRGRLRLLSFVRADVWRLKEDVKSLERHLREITELDKETAARITAYPSKFANDASLIVGFVEEVARNKETIDAVSGKGDLPTANWLHVFTTFSDVIDAIEPLIFDGFVVEDAAARKALEMQLLLLLRGSLAKVKDAPALPRKYVSDLAAAIKLRSDDATGNATIQTKDWDSLAVASLFALGASQARGV